MTDLLASLDMSEHLPDARESAQRTYDRRRARKAADTLAVIPPNRWDEETRRIIATLATINSPSRIDDALEAFDGQPADTLIEITSEYDPGPVPVNYDMPSPYDTPRPPLGGRTWAPCESHGEHPHTRLGEPMLCLDCPTCIGPAHRARLLPGASS